MRERIEGKELDVYKEIKYRMTQMIKKKGRKKHKRITEIRRRLKRMNIDKERMKEAAKKTIEKKAE